MTEGSSENLLKRKFQKKTEKKSMKSSKLPPSKSSFALER
jgi:hypothetical protein